MGYYKTEQQLLKHRESVRRWYLEKRHRNTVDYHDLVKHDYDTQLSTNDAKIAQLKEKGIEI